MDGAQTPASDPSEHQFDVLLEPFEYLATHPGKRFRASLINAFNHWLNVPQPALDTITTVIEMLHTASLLIDDVEDDSDLRRGIPVAHKIFGAPATINSANYVYFLALQKVGHMNRPDLVQVFTEELIRLHQGQGMEIYWRDNLVCPTQDQYLAMIRNKTGGLLRLAVKLMQRCSTVTTDFVPLVDHLGVYFQVRDDYMNLRSTQYSTNKGYCEDIQEGKYSFPVIHSILADASNHQLTSILKQRTADADVKKYALKIMDRTGSFAFTLEYLHQCERTIRQDIQSLGQNVLLEKDLFKVNDTPGPGAYDPVYSPENKYRRYGFLKKSERFQNGKPPPGGDVSSRMRSAGLRDPKRLLAAHRGQRSSSTQRQNSSTAKEKREIDSLQDQTRALLDELDVGRQREAQLQDELASAQESYRQHSRKSQQERDRLCDENRKLKNEAKLRFFIEQETETNYIYRHNTLHHRLAQLESQLAERETELTTLVATRQAELASHEATIQRLNAHIANRNQDLTQANRAKDQIRAKAQNEKMALESELAQLRMQVTNLAADDSARLEELKQLRREWDAEREQLVHERNNQRELIGDLEQQLEAARTRETELTAEGMHVQQELADLHADLQAFESTQQELERQLQAERAEYRNQLEKVGSAQSETIAQAEADQRQFDHDRRQWKTLQSDLQTTINGLEAQVATSQRAESRHRDEIAALEDSCRQLETQLNRTKEAAAEQQADTQQRHTQNLTQLRQSHKVDLDAVHERYQVQVQALERQLNAAQQQAQSQVQRVEATSKQLQSSLHDANEDREAQLEALGIARAKIQTLRTERDEAKQELHLMQDRLSQLQRVHDDDRARIHRHNGMVEDLQLQITTTTRERAQLQQQLKEAESARQADDDALKHQHQYIQELEQSLQVKDQTLQDLRKKQLAVKMTCSTKADLKPLHNQIYQLEQQVLLYEQELKDVQAKAEEEYLALQREKRQLNDTAEDYQIQFESLTSLVEDLRAQAMEADSSRDQMALELEAQVQFLRKNFVLAYEELSKAQGVNAELAGHHNVKQKIRYISQLKDENQRLKRDKLSLEKTRDSLRLRIMHLERDLEAYQAIGISGRQLIQSRVERAYRSKHGTGAPSMAAEHRNSIAVRSELNIDDKENCTLGQPLPRQTPHRSMIGNTILTRSASTQNPPTNPRKRGAAAAASPLVSRPVKKANLGVDSLKSVTTPRAPLRGNTSLMRCHPKTAKCTSKKLGTQINYFNSLSAMKPNRAQSSPSEQVRQLDWDV
ncbi:hypothetical protein H4R34_003234 [Dimargaris verticillata]|uniref:Geranylgeranyl pyrophosphate synthase n=1 Tax=Dimargaris verticillata TaxID=2761393 RepID=A0A9W8B182_9FUNG|nr:hypothetical protein H4R34_003234 [Dimargaris verticillata]